MWTLIETPIDPLRVVSKHDAITTIEFSPFGEPPSSHGERDDDHPALTAARSQLAAYFSGQLTEFELPLAPAGTDFQRQVWAALRQIGYGQTVSYGQIAAELKLGSGAARAIGAANARNPIPIVVPCHRVVGADGSLTGFAGGLDRKTWLLDLERPALF